MIDRVDPFLGTEPADLPAPTGLAAAWWWPKPQIGNTHPGATYPLGMVSACAYSGAYPTGYGRYQLNTEGVPVELYLVVVKKNGCIYDFIYQAPTERFQEHFATFRGFIDPFRTEALR